MKGAAWAAAGAAVLAAVAGWLAIAYDLWGPTYTVGQCDSTGRCETGTATLLQVGLSGTAELFLIAVAALLLGVAVGGVLVATSRRLRGLALMGICVLVLLGATFVSGFSVGPSFLPADILALFALLLASLGRPRSRGREP